MAPADLELIMKLALNSQKSSMPLPGLIWMLLQTLTHSEEAVLDRSYYLALAGLQLAMWTGLL